MVEITTSTDASPLQSGDEIIVIRGGVPLTVTFGELLGQVQAAINLTGAGLLGRAASGSGGPQQLGLGLGVALAGGDLLADALDHTGLRLLGAIDTQAELIVNSGGSPARMLLTDLITWLIQYLDNEIGTIAPENAITGVNGDYLLGVNGDFLTNP